MARLLLQTVEGPRTIELCAFNSLGRHPNNTIQVLDRIASKEHCLIELREGRFVLRDRGSMNGTYVNGERAHGPVTLADGDEISLGSTRAIFHAGAEPEVSSMAEPRIGELPSERILVHLATDKPSYRPGEVLYARAAVLDAETGAAATPSNLAFEIRDASGDVLVSRLSHAAEGVAPFSWTLPADLEDGEHLLYARCPTETFPPAELGFSVRAERPPLLCTELELSRTVYAAGDEVMAALWAGPGEGRGAAGAEVSALATLDGEEIAREALTLDGEGRAWLHFRLPEAIERGAGQVSMIVRDGAAEASVSCALPIAPTRLLLSLQPEGGELVVGLPARLYLEARTPAGAPAEVAGRIIDAGGAVLAHFHTEHEGRGRVMVLPMKAGRAYAAVIDEPAGFPERFPLPDVTREGLSLIALDDRSEADEPLHFRVASTAAMRARLAIHRRDREVGAMPVELGAGEVKDLNLKLPVGATGVLRVTLHDGLGRPRAERLIFRRPPGALRVEIEALPAHPGPRTSMALRVRTTSRGKPVPATVMVSVIDDAIVARVPKRERPPHLPEQVLLGTEVGELGDPAAYLEEGNAAARRLDLLLGTQGWRRFAFYDLARFVGEQGDRAERVLARRKPPVVAVTQAVMLPETAPRAAVGHARGPEISLLLGDAALSAATPGPPAVFHRVASVQHRAGSGASAEGQPLPPFPGPPLPMAVPSAQKVGASGARSRPQTSGAPPPPVGKMVTVREFAHRLGSAEPASPVTTLYWSSGITTSVNGEVTVELDLPDTTGAFRARADAFSALGALGSGEAVIELSRPFSLEPRVPAEVCVGDVIDLPLTLDNASSERLDGRLLLEVEGPLIVGREPIAFSIAPASRERLLVPAAVISGRGRATLRVNASAGSHAQSVAQRIGIVPAGFPMETAVAGRLPADGVHTHLLTVPDAAEQGSLLTDLRFHPGALAWLSSAFEALLDGPSHGLAAQLPVADLAALLIAQSAVGPGVDPLLLRRAKRCVDAASRLSRSEADAPVDEAERARRVEAALADGSPRDLESAALAVLHWAKVGDRARAGSAMEAIFTHAQGSPAHTLMAAQAMVAWEDAYPIEHRAGSLVVSVDGEPVAARSFSAEQRSPIVVPSFADALRPGERRVELRMTGGAPLPYALRLRYHARRPASVDARGLGLSLELGADEVVEGAGVELAVNIENQGGEATAALTAILGLPAGLELPAGAVEGLCAEGAVTRGALRGRELILALPALAAHEHRRFTLPLLGAIPGTYRGPASRAYPGEAEDRAVWAAPLSIRVLAAR